MLLPNNLHQDSLSTFAVELVVEDVLPRPQMEFAVGDCDDNFTAHDLALVVSICIVFARAIVVVALRGRIKRGQFFQPLVIVAMQPRFIVIDEHRRSYVHCVYEYKAILNSALGDKLFYVAMDGNDCSPLRHVHPQFFGQCLHTKQPSTRSYLQLSRAQPSVTIG